jgi:hypothetical protein
LFDARTGDAIRAHDSVFNESNHRNRVTKVVISPNGQLVASDADGDAIVVRELATGHVCKVFRGHQSAVTRMAFTADCRRLVSVSEDMTGIVWDVSYSALARSAAVTRENAWNALAKPDWSDAGPALASLAAKPDEFIVFVQKKLPSADKPDFDLAAVSTSLKQLDAKQGDSREQAIAKLSGLSRDILPTLREHLPKETDRAKRDLERVIDRINELPVPLDQLRQTRVVALLAQIESPEARHELERLAAGHPQAQLTRDAKAALKVANP